MNQYKSKSYYRNREINSALEVRFEVRLIFERIQGLGVWSRCGARGMASGLAPPALGLAALGLALAQEIHGAICFLAQILFQAR
jgi:hypothetical protein